MSSFLALVQEAPVPTREVLLKAEATSTEPLSLLRPKNVREPEPSTENITGRMIGKWLSEAIDVALGPPPLQSPVHPSLLVALEVAAKITREVVNSAEIEKQAASPLMRVFACPVMGGLAWLKCPEVCETIPILATAAVTVLAKTASKESPDKECLELFLELVCLIQPIATYPLNSLLAVTREHLCDIPAAVRLHSLLLGSIDETIMREMLKLPNKLQQVPPSEKKGKEEKKQKSGGKKGAAKQAINTEAQPPPRTVLCVGLPSLLELSKVPLEPAAETLLRRELESNGRFSNAVGKDSNAAANLLERFGSPLLAKLSPHALAAVTTEETKPFLVQLCEAHPNSELEEHTIASTYGWLRGFAKCVMLAKGTETPYGVLKVLAHLNQTGPLPLLHPHMGVITAQSMLTIQGLLPKLSNDRASFYRLGSSALEPLASERCRRYFAVPLAPTLSEELMDSVLSVFKTKISSPSTTPRAKDAKGKNKKKGAAGSPSPTTDKNSTSKSDEGLIAVVLRFLNFAFEATYSASKEETQTPRSPTEDAEGPKNVTWWRRVVGHAGRLTHTDSKTTNLALRLSLSAVLNNVIDPVEFVASSEPLVLGGIVLNSPTSLELLRLVSTNVADTGSTCTGRAHLQKPLVHALGRLVSDPAQEVRVDAITTLAAVVFVNPPILSDGELQDLSPAFQRLVELQDPETAFPHNTAAQIALRMLQRKHEEMANEREEKLHKEREQREQRQAEELRTACEKEQKRRELELREKETQRKYRVRHEAFETAVKKTVQGMLAAENRKLHEEEKEREGKRAVNAKKLQSAADEKYVEQDAVRRSKALQRQATEQHLQHLSSFLVSLEVAPHRVVELINKLRQLYPVPAALVEVSQQALLELLIAGEAKEATDILVNTAGSPIIQSHRQKQLGHKGEEEEPANVKFWDDFNFWGDVGEEAVEGSDEGGEEHNTELKPGEKATGSLHKRLSFVLNLFDYDHPSTTTVPRGSLPWRDEEAKREGWNDGAHAAFVAENKGLIAGQKDQTGTNTLLSLTLLGWAYHVNYANSKERFSVLQEGKRAALLSEAPRLVHVGELAKEQAGGTGVVSEEREEQKEVQGFLFLDELA